MQAAHVRNITVATAPSPVSDANAVLFVLLEDVAPTIRQDIRYCTSYNFVGRRIHGYEDPCAILTATAAQALRQVAEDLAPRKIGLKVYDAYRPQEAVNDFIAWSRNADVRMKPYFYPEEDKRRLFRKGYLAARSGHSRGSTVDLTLVDLATGAALDMGGTFDYFGIRSHFEYEALTAKQAENRRLLRRAMTRRGFVPIPTEWWHFTLKPEPYPTTYFTFPVSRKAVISS